MPSSEQPIVQEPNPAAGEVDLQSSDTEPDQLASAHKRIEELEERHLRQEMEIRRLEAALRKASFTLSPLHYGNALADKLCAPSSSTKSVEEMTSAPSGAPSSQPTPRTASSANEAEPGLSLASISSIEGLAAAAAAAMPAPQPDKEEPYEDVGQDLQALEEPHEDSNQDWQALAEPASIPSTPEMPVCELSSLEIASATSKFFDQFPAFHTGASCAEARDFYASGPSASSCAMPHEYSSEYASGYAPAMSSTQVIADAHSSAGAFPAPVWYRVAFCGGICARTAPDVDAPRTGLMMPCNEVFAVSEAIQGADKRVYLRLADGRGWVFDDSELFPEDPAVVRGHWAPASQEQSIAHVPLQEVPPPPTTPANGPPQMSPSHSTALQPAVEGTCPAPVTGASSGQPCQEIYSLAAVAASAVGPSMGTPVPPPPHAAPPSAAQLAPLTPAPLQMPGHRPLAWYRVAFCGGISVRMAPDVDAPRTGVTLPCNEIFAVAETVLGPDQRLYLRLMDGRGWVFDDIMLVPEDPAVIRVDTPVPQGHYAPHSAPLHPPHGMPPGAWQLGTVPMTNMPQPRSGQGGQSAGSMLSTVMPGAEQQQWLAQHPVQATNPALGMASVDAFVAHLSETSRRACPEGTARRWTRGKRGGLKKHRRRQQTQTPTA